MRFRYDLFLRCARGRCPDCGAPEQLTGLATIRDRCTACGMEIRLRGRVQLARPAGPPPGGAARA